MTAFNVGTVGFLFVGIMSNAAVGGQAPASAPNAAEQCVETSKDGLLTVEIGEDLAAAGINAAGGIAGGAAGASAVPFGLTPDWTNNKRLAVAAVQVADMNGDGWNDLVVGCFSSNSFPPYKDWHNFIYYNTGGQLEAEPSWTSADQVHTTDIQIADLNQDGFPDIFAANGGCQYSPSVIYFGGPGGPSTTPGWTSQTPQITWAVTATLFDFDHDGDLDIITTNQACAPPSPATRPLYLFRNHASMGGDIDTVPSWQSADVMISNGIAVGDYDNDGWEDIAVAKWVNFQSGIYRNVNGALQTLPIWTTGDDDGARGAAMADFDGNGWLDVVFGYDPTRLYSSDKGEFTMTWETQAPFSGPQELHAYDFDHDGDQDIAEVYFSNGNLHLYVNNNGTFNTTPDWTYDAPNVGNALAFGDINGDGCDDLVMGLSGDISLRVFYAQCDKPACLGNVNGDGQVDVADLLAVISAWGPCPAAPGNCPADINGNGVVNVEDLLAVITAWGPCE